MVAGLPRVRRHLPLCWSPPEGRRRQQPSAAGCVAGRGWRGLSARPGSRGEGRVGGRAGGEPGASCQGLRRRSPPNRPHSGAGRKTGLLKGLSVSLACHASAATTLAFLKLYII